MTETYEASLDIATVPVFDVAVGKHITCMFSRGDERTYRYQWRTEVNPEGRQGLCNFLMLNPSTADCEGPDPTVTRCMNYAREWGYSDLVVTNVFAYRSTNPDRLKEVTNPIGQYNNRVIMDVAREADLVLCAWGTHGHGRGQTVARMLRQNEIKLHALTLTQDGHPGHPLYLKKDLTPRVWSAERGLD